MDKFASKLDKQITTPLVPQTCGVHGCGNACDVFIRGRGIARCSKHYQADVDRYRGHDDGLRSLGLVKKPGESNHEYAMRCKAKSSEMMAGGFRSLISD